MNGVDQNNLLEKPGEVFGLLVFDSTNIAMKTEKALKSVGVRCIVIPTPVEVSADCGISLLLEENCVPRAGQVLKGIKSRGTTLIYPFERKK